jgi:hypothetical protein
VLLSHVPLIPDRMSGESHTPYSNENCIGQSSRRLQIHLNGVTSLRRVAATPDMPAKEKLTSIRLGNNARDLNLTIGCSFYACSCEKCDDAVFILHGKDQDRAQLDSP